ncbi:MAG: hypothetical protein AAGH89_08100, partial [Verrucomicrobiota bacterium]
DIEIEVISEQEALDETGAFHLPSIPRNHKFYFGYSYVRVQADGLINGSRRVSQEFVLADFPVTPTDMTIDIHSFYLRWQPSGPFSFEASMPYVWQNTDLRTAYTAFSMQTEGFGDLVLRPTYHRHLVGCTTLSASLALSIPTADLDRDLTNTILPYAAQVTSGSYELRPKIEFSGGLFDLPNWESGVAGGATLRLDDNDDGFRFGDLYWASAWIQNSVNDWMDVTGFILGTHWKEIDGISNTLPTGPAPPFDPENYGGDLFEVGGRLRLTYPGDPYRDRHLAVQYAVPLHQNLNGTQLRLGWTLGVSTGWSF